jgi:dihydrolipoamide dehydrogenase
MADTSFDLVIIGSGPGGYVAAIRAAQLKLSVAIVEHAELGGICLNWGCIPTKALLRSAEINHLLHNLDAYGFSAKDISFDIGKIVKRSRAVAGQLSNGVKFLLKKNKVPVFDGTAKLDGIAGGLRKIKIEKNGKPVADLTAKNVILATGARARNLAGLEPDGKLVWSYREAMVPDTMPKSLLVIGSGAIGIEFASFFHNLGAKVTVVEMLDRILPVEDEEISGFARKSFEKQGMRIITSASVKDVKKSADAVSVTIAGKDKSESATFDRVITAVGIVGNVENLGLEGTKVKVDRTHVVVDEAMFTGEPGVFAIGDLIGPPWLAHKASHEGVMCVERIAGIKGVHPLDVDNIPGCTYCSPQVASVGLTEARARAAGHDVKVGHFPYIGNGKAIALGEPEGMVKTVFDAKTGQLLGAHMIGAEVTELIQGYVIGKTLETTEAELMETIFPHPTLSETMHESVLDAYGKVIHI